MQMARKIVVNGEDRTAVFNALFISLEINDAAGRKSDSLTLTLADDGKVSLPDVEADIDIWTGYNPERLTYKGRFTVEDISLSFPGRQLVISASGAQLRGQMKTQRNHTWEPASLYQIAQQVAERNGFIPAISADLKQIQVPHRVQRGQSDTDLLQQLADEYDCTLKCTGGRLVYFPLGDNRNVQGQTGPAIPLALTGQVKGRVKIAGRAAMDGVQAVWRDLDAGTLRYEKVGDSEGRLKTLPGEYPDQNSARAAASAEWHRAQRKGYQLQIREMPAIPQLAAERLAQVSGHPRSQFNTGWMVEEITEHQDEKGFWQSLKAVVPKDNGAKVPGMIKKR